MLRRMIGLLVVIRMRRAMHYICDGWLALVSLHGQAVNQNSALLNRAAVSRFVHCFSVASHARGYGINMLIKCKHM